MSKNELANLTEKRIIQEMFKYERDLRQFFLKLREEEQKGRRTTYDITIKTALPTPYDLEERYELEEDLPGCKMFYANIYATYNIFGAKQKRVLKSDSVLINNPIGMGLPCKLYYSEEEHNKVLQRCDELVKELAELIFLNWKKMNPLLIELLEESKPKYKMFILQNGTEPIIGWSTSFSKINEKYGVEEGKFRYVRQNSSTSNSVPENARECTTDEIGYIFSNCDISSPYDFSTLLQEEKELNGLREEVQQKYGWAMH